MSSNPDVVKVVTLNLAGMRDGWLDKRFDVVVKGLAPLAPDLICFQEATVRGRGPLYRQAVAVGRALGLSYGAFAPYGNAIEIMSHERGGVAIASRWPLGYVETLRLPEGSSEVTDNRVALLASVITPAGEWHVVTLHLSWRATEAEMRLVQLGLVLDFLGHAGLHGLDDSRLLIAGDFNATEREPVVALAGEHLTDVFRAAHPDDPGHTWSKVNPLTGDWPDPDRRLDYMFVPKGTRVQAARVVLDHPDPVYASDHFGLYAELAFPQAGS